MNSFLTPLLGTSWRTSLMGFLEGIFYATADYYVSGQQITWHAIVVLLIGVIRGRVSRDNKITSEQANG